MNDAEIRQLAFRPLVAMDRPRDWVYVDCPGVDVVVHSLPLAKIAVPRPELTGSDLPAAIAAVRETTAVHNLSALLWWLPDDLDHLRADLEREGLVNRASEGYEAVETAMVLDHPPKGPVDPEIEVAAVASLGDARASAEVTEQAFEMPTGQMSGAAESMWAQAQEPDYPFRQYVARLNGEIVGAAAAATGPGGINLFGGSVLASARRRGVYTAMIAHRWHIAARRSTPVLTVQAGRQSSPVLRQAGFRVLGRIHVYVDPYLASATSA